jgi:hypothetical protein
LSESVLNLLQPGSAFSTVVTVLEVVCHLKVRPAVEYREKLHIGELRGSRTGHEKAISF